MPLLFETFRLGSPLAEVGHDISPMQDMSPETPGDHEKPDEQPDYATTGQIEESSAPASEAKLMPPPGFEFDEDLMADYDEQVALAIARQAYQDKPIPSFEDIPKVDVTPTFNSSDAPDSEIYARERVSDDLRIMGYAPRSEFTDSKQPVEMWRILERSTLEDGTGLVSSRILRDGNLGDVENFDPSKHLASNHESRSSEREDNTTPFVSFSTDPENLAKLYILKYGFGVKDGLDSVVVKVQVDPGRVITGPQDKTPEVLLLGGVAPEEYAGAYSVADFVSQFDTQEEFTTIDGEKMPYNQVLGHWALRGQVKEA